MTVQYVFPKVDGDILYGSSNGEANSFNMINTLAGESLTAGNVIYLNKTTGRAWKSGTGAANTIRANGIVLNTCSTGNAAYILLRGNWTTSGLTANTAYYLGASGGISTTKSGVLVGYAYSTTVLNLDIVQDDRDAVGMIKPYLKTFTGIPSNNMTAFWKECDGTTLSDAESPLNGQTLPNLNGSTYFVRGASTSGGTGGSLTHKHAIDTGDIDQYVVESGSNSPYYVINTNMPETTDSGNIPPYYNVVWIMKVK